MERHRIALKNNAAKDEKYIDTAFGKNALNERAKLFNAHMNECKRQKESNTHKQCLYTSATKALRVKNGT